MSTLKMWLQMPRTVLSSPLDAVRVSSASGTYNIVILDSLLMISKYHTYVPVSIARNILP